jgi:V/A-type H+-transporting ATPase subunit K
MIKNRLARKVVFGLTFVGVMLVPAMALAAETGTTGAPTASDWRVLVARAASAGVVMTFSAMSAGYAQAKIGSAGAGTLAERPEVATNIIVLQALPEIIALLGFVIAFMIGTAA